MLKSEFYHDAETLITKSTKKHLNNKLLQSVDMHSQSIGSEV